MEILPEILSSSPQKIKHSNESECCTEVYSREILVHCRSNAHNHGSSKVKLTNRIDYNWEFRYYLGQLVAAHTEKNIIAYAMKGKDGGMVRVINQDTNERALIKNLKNDVRDVSFAFTKTEIILGCVDDEGNVLIYEIFDKKTEITCNLLFHIYHPDHAGTPPSNFRLYWCPYVPSSDDDLESAEDASKTFIFLNGSKAEVWDISLANSKYGEGPCTLSDTSECAVEIDHKTDLVDAAFSSDGTAMAIACLNGFVYFYQVYVYPKPEKKLLHEWKPHEGKQLSCLLFIDNIIDYTPETRFWKFAMTGANHNQEIKIWSCENWVCIQTIHFVPSPACIIPSVFLKIRIDYRGQYVIMCDINNRTLYILKLIKYNTDKLVCLSWISEFLLPAPFLSYHILDANERKSPQVDCDEEPYNPDDFEDDDEEEPFDMTEIKMLVIQPKKFQECDILFSPRQIMNNSSEVIVESNDKHEKSIDNTPKLDDLQTSVTLLIQQQAAKPQLMTPEAFTSPGQGSRPNSVRNSLSNEGSISGNKSVEKINENDIDNLIDLDRPQKDNFASGGSSPSREVQEILKKTNYSSQEFFDKLSNSGDAEEPQKPYSQSENVYQGNNSIIWPKIPVIEDNEIVKDDGVHKFNSGESNDNSTKVDISLLNYRLTNVENAVRKQTVYLEQILDNIKAANSQKETAYENCIEEYVKELDVAFSKQHLQIAKLLENLVNIQKTTDCEKQEQFAANVSQMLSKTILEGMQPILVQELKNAHGPAIRSILDTIKHQLDKQFSLKSQATDQSVKESIAKFFNNKSFAESFGMSVVGVMGPVLEKNYKDMIGSYLIPSVEKVCQGMFQQIGATFTQGTKEYMTSVEVYMERQRKIQEQSKDLVVQMQSVSEMMKNNADKLSNILVKEFNKNLNLSFKTLQEKIMQNMKEVISEQVQQGFRSQASLIEDSVLNAVRSRAVTPSPQVPDSQNVLAQIQQSLTKGNYSEAFQLALTAENLSYVIYVCEKVDVHKFSSNEIPLSQSCLLALIQQLSVDLTNYTDLKLSYIRVALLGLSPDHPTTRTFIPRVLNELLKQLRIFMATSPPTQHMTEAKLLTMAAESMVMK